MVQAVYGTYRLTEIWVLTQWAEPNKQAGLTDIMALPKLDKPMMAALTSKLSSDYGSEWAEQAVKIGRKLFCPELCCSDLL